MGFVISRLSVRFRLAAPVADSSRPSTGGFSLRILTVLCPSYDGVLNRLKIA